MPEHPLTLSLSKGDWLLLLAPLLLLGFAAGALRVLSLRPGLPARRRKGLTAAWVLLLLVGGPVWLFLAAAIRGR